MKLTQDGAHYPLHLLPLAADRFIQSRCTQKQSCSPFRELSTGIKHLNFHSLFKTDSTLNNTTVVVRRLEWMKKETFWGKKSNKLPITERGVANMNVNGPSRGRWGYHGRYFLLDQRPERIDGWPLERRPFAISPVDREKSKLFDRWPHITAYHLHLHRFNFQVEKKNIQLDSDRIRSRDWRPLVPLVILSYWLNWCSTRLGDECFQAQTGRKYNA